MRLRVGTFNLNNLFSRYNFATEVDALVGGDAEIEVSTTFDPSDPSRIKLRTYQGRLVKGKSAQDRQRVADRIAAIDCDVLAVQEVEDVDTLQRFARDDLASSGYRYVVLVEGNDPRLIDVGLVSRLPIGAVTSWRHAVHPADPGLPVFGRDLLEVEILNDSRSRRLLTVFNNHLKSHFVPFTEDPSVGAERANQRRQQQAETAAQIIEARTRPDSPFVVVGDMNDPPESSQLRALVDGLVNGMAEAVESRPAPADDPPAPPRPWTHRFKETGQPADYELFDHVWLSPALSDDLLDARIDRRTRLGGDGSDHDPAWVDLSR
ncbi:MAG: endonuclease/exonuclease/phosphatase family protein [Acidimicrobiia bacterium]